MPKIKSRFPKETERMLMQRVIQFLDAETGYIFIMDDKTKRLTDITWGVCKHCIMNQIAAQLDDAEKQGLLAMPKGHTHE